MSAAHSCPECGNADTDLIFNGMAVHKCLCCGHEWLAPAPAKTVLTFDAAMQVARRSFADSTLPSRWGMPTPAPTITMTAANLVKFFQLASKEYLP